MSLEARPISCEELPLLFWRSIGNRQALFFVPVAWLSPPPALAVSASFLFSSHTALPSLSSFYPYHIFSIQASSTMTDTLLTLFCLVDGQSKSSTSSTFPVPMLYTKTVGELRKAIKAEKPNAFKDIDADSLALWRVTIPVVSVDKHKSIVLNKLDSTELEPTDKLSVVFEETPLENTIHIIIQPPPQGNAALPFSKYCSYCGHHLATDESISSRSAQSSPVSDHISLRRLLTEGKNPTRRPRVYHFCRLRAISNLSIIE